MVGYLLVRVGVHIVADAKALEKLTGVEVGKLRRSPTSTTSDSPQLSAPLGPEIDPERFGLIATRLFGNAAGKAFRP